MTEDIIEAEAVEEGENLPVVAAPSPSTALVAQDELSVQELLKQGQIITEAMRQAMTEDVHYGKIPGVQKPTLLKPGAEKLNVLFRLAPSYHSDKTFHDDGHLTVVARCVLTHIPTDLVVGEGEGLCTTLESRYAFRRGERVCPECGEPQVRKGKARDGRPGNWYCWKKQGGCGATWDLDSEQGRVFDGMDTGRVPNPDLADTWNTVLKMADKRALIAAVLNCTAASDVFTQDVEDAPRDDSRADAGGSPRGAGATDPPAEEPFPKMLPDAPNGEGMWVRLAEMQQHVDPLLDWKAVSAALMGLRYSGRNRSELTQDEIREFGVRWVNAVTRMSRLMVGDFPALEPEKIRAEIAWAFEGLAVALTWVTREEPAGVDAEEIHGHEQAQMGGAYREDA